MTEQRRLKDLLKQDEFYRKWFTTPPKITVVHSTPPWRLFVQKEQNGRWARADIPSYAKAVAAVKSRLPDVWDMAIHCKPQGFRPPVLRFNGKKIYDPAPVGHAWCMFCRRFVVFDNFVRHPNSRVQIPYEEEQCLICGARKEGMRKFPSPMNWPVTSAK